MIIQLRGIVTHKDPEYLILSVNGVGYKVFVTPTTVAYSPESKEILLWTHQVVRETALDLYGFLHQMDLDFFELLIGVSGVGPKSALGILSLADTASLSGAIAQGDTTYLTKVSGIGAKSAKKIVLELSDKVSALSSSETHIYKDDADAIDALVTMGYSIAEARNALKDISHEIIGASARLKEALKILSSV